ncbi:MAG: adenylate/guanylate cyclase domain-containing protein [Spirochaetaceae bacterium]|nr:MAG: adenylate/guanylate cyclase domain-containing protein [Spirochaetaceae bacterium]
MARGRARFLETRYFGLIIGLVIVLIVSAINWGTPLIERMELRTLDLHFRLKQAFVGERVEEGVTVVERNPFVSDDILIIGIDFSTLSQIGRWPFPRSRHADLIRAFARVQDQSRRERALFLDLFFIEPERDAVNDALLLQAMRENERVFLETILESSDPPAGSEDELFARHEALFAAGGRIASVRGNTGAMPSHFGLQPPLQPLGREVAGYGHANFVEDSDQVYRRQALVSKLSRLIETVRLEELSESTQINTEAHQRLVWFDRSGRDHTVAAPLTGEVLRQLRDTMQQSAPKRTDPQSGESYHQVRLYQDYFIPSITLALAADYFGAQLEDLEVVLGSHVLIPEPRTYDRHEGRWRPYEVRRRPARVRGGGSVSAAAVYEALEEIRIPIDEQGAMLINFMGPRSSAARDGRQTFPVRPYAGYAARVPGPDPSTWPPTRAVENTILMVGAFAPGMAADELTTPFGLMYGVEVHANALNTIIMDRFVRYVPRWVDLLAIVALAGLTSLMASRLSIVWSFLVSLAALVVWFFATSLVFDSRGYILNFSGPSLALIFCFVSIVVYRVMTEEKDKRRIREMFGKYVSPRVVDQILERPPELGGVDKEITVFFSDIRGFTTLSESLTPQELVNHLNIYLTAMTDIILDYQGTLDKYVGDEIMCFWGAPLPQPEHALLACQCALRQMEVLGELNDAWPPEKQIRIGIGINSGIMTVGNMGSLGRMNYTLMGDNVNLAARLEGTNKQYETSIIMSEYTYGLVKEHAIARELDNIRVKGKNRPVLIYELIDILDQQPKRTA